jgi:hypothetical protein
MAKKKEQITIREYISQKAIDELIESAFVEQAEAADELELELSDLAETTTFDSSPDNDDLGFISNDDIAALLKGASPGGTPKALSSDDNTGSLVSQSDIDALLSGGLDAVVSSKPPKTESQADVGGLVSQSDIDALLSGGLDAVVSSKPPKTESQADAGGLVSQSDIDALLGGGLNAVARSKPPKPEPQANAGGLVSQSDIDALLSGGLDEVTPSPPVKNKTEANIDGLISQSDIDALLKGEMGSTPADEPPESAGGEGVISQADLDALFSGTQSVVNEDPGESGLISQSDIDALLGGGAKEEPKAEDTFEPIERNETGDVISQSDIDALLKGAISSDEEPGGRGKEDTRTPVVSQSDIDSLFGDSLGEKALEETEREPEPVILADGAEETEVSEPETSGFSQRWYTRSVFQISAMAALVLIISSSVYFVKSRSGKIAPKAVVLTFPIPKAASQTVTAKMVGNTSVAMPGFLVLAPADNKDMTCLSADVLLDFSDTDTLRRIKENEGVIRNIIYNVMNDALLSSNKNLMEKSNMALAVREALGRVVQREMIRTVTFEKFEII